METTAHGLQNDLKLRPRLDLPVLIYRLREKLAGLKPYQIWVVRRRGYGVLASQSLNDGEV